MGPECKRELQSPSDLGKKLQENTSLISETERMIAELDELLRSAKRLLDEQRAIVQKLNDEERK